MFPEETESTNERAVATGTQLGCGKRGSLLFCDILACGAFTYQSITPPS